MKKLMLLFVAVMSLALAASAQNRKISGTVLSDEDGEPLVGATVMPLGGGTGTATNIDGQFTLNVPPSVKQLRITYVGMHEATVPAEDGIVARLINSTNKLDEVLIVAYGTAKKSEYTGAASQVGAADLQDALVTSATSALVGKVSGVQTTQTTGAPGTAPSVIIRGVGTIQASTAPLYVVDGMPMSPTFNISLLNTQDIETMTVLKDAASTSLYGARGANGVIMITTKSGKSDKVKVTVDARWGANSRMNADYDKITDPAQYTRMLGMAQYNNQVYNLNKTPQAALDAVNAMLGTTFGTNCRVWDLPAGEKFFLNTNMDINPNASLGWSDGTYYYTPDDWADGTYHNGFRQEYNASVQNSSDKINLFLSLGYLTDAGLIKNSHFNRLTTRTSVDYNAKKWLKLGTNMSYTYVNAATPRDQDTNSSTSTGNAFRAANMMGPLYPMYARNPDGTIMYNQATGYPVYDYGQATYGTGNYTRNWMSGANPVGSQLYDKRNFLRDYFTGKWYATVTPIDGLNITGALNYDVQNLRDNTLYNNMYGQFANAETNGSVTQKRQRQRTITAQILASYARTFADKHNVNVVAGYETLSYNFDDVSGSGNNVYFYNQPYLSNVIDNLTNSGYNLGYATRGWLFNAKYNFDTRYYVTFGIRRDASSRFAPDHRWGTFLNGSIGWDVAKEKFMQDVNWVDMLKIRASIGQNGNDNLGSTDADFFPYLDLYQLSGGNGVWADGTLYNKGNVDLTWEKQTNWNVGLDFSLWNGRLDGSVEYYQKETKDMLYYVPTSPSLGYAYMPMNVGSLRNNGVEIELNGTIINTKDVQWDANFNITIPRSKVIKLHPDLNGKWPTRNYIYIEGEPMYQFNLIKYAGVDPTTGLALYWDKDDNGNEFVTTNAGSAYSNNRTPSGDCQVKGYGGFGTEVRFYGFNVGIQFAYQFGGKLLDYTYCDLMYGGNSSSIGQAMHKDLLNAWTPENPYTDVPRLSSGDQYTNGNQTYACDRWLTSSNYLKIQNITVGYTFKPAWTRSLGIEELRIYGSAENVAQWTARKGLVVGQNFRYSTSAAYGISRVIMGGIHLTF